MAAPPVGLTGEQAEPFMTLAPLGGVIEAEVWIEARDIGRIRFGDAARIKLDTFPFQHLDRSHAPAWKHLGTLPRPDWTEKTCG